MVKRGEAVKHPSSMSKYGNRGVAMMPPKKMRRECEGAFIPPQREEGKGMGVERLWFPKKKGRSAGELWYCPHLLSEEEEEGCGPPPPRWRKH
jgi:hypothetical protein